MHTTVEVKQTRRVQRTTGRRGNLTFLAISLLPEGRKPALPAFTTDHRHLLVPNEESDNLSVVSLEDLAVVRVIPLRPGSRPWQAKVIPPDGRLAYVTNTRFDGTAHASPREPSTVSVIDLQDGKMVDEIPVGAGPNGVTVDQLGRRGYVANMRSDTISVIDVAAGRVVETLPTGRAPAFAKLSRDLAGRLLVVTNLEDSSVTVYDTERLEVIRTVHVGIPGLNDTYPEWGPGDTTGVAISASNVAFLTNYRSHSIVVLDLTDFSLQRLPCPIRFPFFVEIDREMGVVVFSSGIERRFALLDVETLEWLGEYPNDGTVLPHDRIRSLNIWMTDPDHHRLTAILPNGIEGISRDWDRNMVTKFM